MQFKLMPFRELVAKSQEKLDEALAPLRAAKAQSQAKTKMCEIEEQILTKQSQIQEMCVKKDIDFDKVADAIDEIELLELRKSRFEKIVKELFPD